jgi:hypothetical protein
LGEVEGEIGEGACINFIYMETILEGSKRLLLESVDLLGEQANDVIIVGGWGPFLRHEDVHPGTKDVDILFPQEYSKDDMMGVVRQFLENGFFINAKHDFQLCKAYKIGENSYIYNVDLLHPTNGKVNKVDFLDIMDLDVTVDGIIVKKVITINIQHGDVIYNDRLFERRTFENRTFNVLDGPGIVISKMDSCHNKKRQRDIYDIYLSLQENDTIGKINYLVSGSPILTKQLKEYKKRIKSNWELYESFLSEFGVNDQDAQNFLLMKNKKRKELRG